MPDCSRHRLGGPTARVVGNVANNHSHDAGSDGLLTSIALLDSAGVHVTGADTLATRVITHRGDTVAFLGFYTGSDSPDARNLAGVKGENSDHVVKYDAGKWNCTCAYFQNHLLCSHTMAVEIILSSMVEKGEHPEL